MRRTNLNQLSSRLLNYLVEKHGLSLTQIATITGVDKSFISRVKSASREFSIDHLDMIADHLGVEVGVLLIASGKPLSATTDPNRRKLREMCQEFILAADAFTATLKKKQKSDAA